MNKIEELLHRYCPNGVAYKNLGDVCEFQRGSSITQKNVTHGTVPVIAGGQTPAYYHNTSNRIGDVIAVSASGAYAGFVSYWTVPVFLSDSFSVNPNSKILVKKYVYYFLKHNQSRIHDTKKGSGVPHVHGSSISKIPIPIPPLPIQQEIVNILDKFTQLEAELEAELEARNKQYTHYRKQLLNLKGTDFEWKHLGEVGEVLRGRRLTKNQLSADERYPVFHGGLEPLGFYRQSNRSANTVMIINVGASAGTIGYSTVDFWSSDGCFCIKHTELLNSRYLYYALLCKETVLRSKVRVAGIPTLDAIAVENIQIPIPSLVEQERIVYILDKFEELIKKSLPAEIIARKKQYEYYRNKLLTFKPLENE